MTHLDTAPLCLPTCLLVSFHTRDLLPPAYHRILPVLRRFLTSSAFRGIREPNGPTNKDPGWTSDVGRLRPLKPRVGGRRRTSPTGPRIGGGKTQTRHMAHRARA